ncbi:adenylate kinase [Porphyromonas levii]|uniref:Adenylate kinase n=1 Tax=Porphyromonas levii TaxID=28114 RepID=A0A4Y8WQ61_9PORP|nr:adenylate kinase [Porphyromonas levii]MBR8704096.1 adenylate kinase [Porphyromonas levii]MBR8732129.1 adenylate kinase [Porphyromonas levii]MBR8760553.1 adenylate kinase [Porphyromonas levii]MBR8764403.1 adenylate kinase [Porphyromonas levii]MBR8765835.1 adenylate kinase [Porphyromonas levii]
MLNLLIFGAPGSGKGTQSKFLAEHYGIEHISTGDLLRGEVAEGSEMGHKVEALISQGNLVPDELILKILFDHINNIKDYKGLILDGFPRTIVQAKELIREFQDRSWKLPLLVALDVPEGQLMERLLVRSKVSGRSDDNEETISKRFRVYREQSEPIISYFEEQDYPLVSINGEGTIEGITQRLIDGIDKYTK